MLIANRYTLNSEYLLNDHQTLNESSENNLTSSLTLSMSVDPHLYGTNILDDLGYDREIVSTSFDYKVKIISG